MPFSTHGAVSRAFRVGFIFETGVSVSAGFREKIRRAYMPIAVAEPFRLPSLLSLTPKLASTDYLRNSHYRC